jgi:hypothetical protein
LALWETDAVFSGRLHCFQDAFSSLPMVAIRKLGLQTWQRNVWRSLRRYLHKTYGDDWVVNRESLGESSLESTLTSARDCIHHCMWADWWDWTAGSRPLFWRWPHESQEWALDGLPIPIVRAPKPYRRSQPPERDPKVVTAVRGKLDKFRSKGYVAKGTVEGLTSFFTVPKGEGDVRLVFDGTKSGLNNIIWAPSFTLPSMSSLLSTLEPGTWMDDIDVAEQFYNFLLDLAIQPFCGVDLSPYFPELTSWERWTRCIMGIKTSPHGCIRTDLLGDEVNRGNHLSPENSFYYDELRLNLPGSATYTPSLPWVSKVNTSTGCLAGDIKTYVDDKHPTGCSYDHCRRLARRTASILSYLGMQDASRKREAPSLRAGAWLGIVCHMTRLQSESFAHKTNGKRHRFTFRTCSRSLKLLICLNSKN